MTIDKKKLDVLLASRCMSASDMRGKLSPATITRIRKGGQAVGTKTVGKIARALGVDVTEIIEREV